MIIVVWCYEVYGINIMYNGQAKINDLAESNIELFEDIKNIFVLLKIIVTVKAGIVLAIVCCGGGWTFINEAWKMYHIVIWVKVFNLTLLESPLFW